MTRKDNKQKPKGKQAHADKQAPQPTELKKTVKIAQKNLRLAKDALQNAKRDAKDAKRELKRARKRLRQLAKRKSAKSSEAKTKQRKAAAEPSNKPSARQPAAPKELRVKVASSPEPRRKVQRKKGKPPAHATTTHEAPALMPEPDPSESS